MDLRSPFVDLGELGQRFWAGATHRGGDGAERACHNFPISYSLR